MEASRPNREVIFNMAKEFEKAQYNSESEPGQSAMGASVIDFGEQRYGVGVKGQEATTYVEPGSEGAMSVKLQKGNGGFSASGSYPEGTSDGITGA